MIAVNVTVTAPIVAAATGAPLWVAVALAIGLSAAGQRAAAQVDSRQVFEADCAECHAADGRGKPGQYPPLTDHLDDIAALPGGREFLANVVLYGMVGPIEIEGETYLNTQMPSFFSLDDAALAGVLNHVLFELAEPRADVPPFAAEEIALARRPFRSNTEMYRLRGQLLGAVEETSGN
jgi:mono/diheme cytochrome c family protein